MWENRVLRIRGTRAWALCFVLFGVISSLLVVNRELLNNRQAPVALVLVMVVLLGSVTGGRVLGLSLAFAGFLVINYYFQLPYYDFAVHDPADWIVLVTFVLAADVGSRLIARERRLLEAAQRRAAEVQRLADLGAETLAPARSTDALRAIAEVIARTLHLDRCELWEVAAGGARCVTVAPSDAPSDPPSDARADPSGADALRARVAAAAARPPASTAEERAQRVEDLLAGAPRDALLTLSAHGHPVGVLRLVRGGGLALDESERTFLQALSYYAALGVERARLSDELRRAWEAREADRMKDFVLATVSHDLRTPLTTIKALANESARVGSDVAVRNAAVIEEQADRLARMVADVLDLSRARAGALPLAQELNTAEDVVGAALRQVGGALRGRAVETRLRDDGGPLVGSFDFVATLRVLGNLIENAAKYGGDPRAPIVLDVVRDGDTLAFSVGDRGAGVPPAERERIFVPFYRAPGATPDAGGTGLGLAVARALAEAQGGTVEYAPRDGGGSVFTLRLPASSDATALRLIEDAAAD